MDTTSDLPTGAPAVVASAPANVTLQVVAPSPAGKPAPWWAAILNSAVVVAAVTALMGGVLGNLIVARYQRNAAERERTLTQYREFITRQQAAVDDTYRLLGEGFADAEDVLAVVSPEFDPRSVAPAQRPVLAKQKQELIDRHNTWSRKWPAERLRVGSLVGYYHFGDATVRAKWDAASRAIEAFQKCAEATYLQHYNDPRPVDNLAAACANQRQAVERGLTDLGDALEQARRFPWEAGTPSPRRE